MQVESERVVIVKDEYIQYLINQRLIAFLMTERFAETYRTIYMPAG